jgi:hypothetical protein
MGSAQKDERARITHENHKLLVAVQERRPCLNRNDWLHHRLDHQYQITKMSEYKRTVPMGEIIRQEQIRTSGDAVLGDVIGDTIGGSRPPPGPVDEPGAQDDTVIGGSQAPEEENADEPGPSG